MRTIFKFALTGLLAACSANAVRSQDLSPRAYVITPIHWNAVTVTYSFSDGDVLLNGSVPITDGTARLNTEVLTYFHTMNFFGRSANISASLPYSSGHLKGTFMDNETRVYRSGLMDSSYRFSVNLMGGPAMTPREYQSWRQKTILGVSLRMVAPTGQYDPTKLINLGANRWAFKPEFGYSRRWGHWVLDGYAGAWFFTTNPEFFSHNAFFAGSRSQSQAPVSSFEGHFSYDVRPRFWISLDGNFWYGGRTSVSGVENTVSLQKNSRVGVTASVPVTKRQSLKFSYNNGAYVRFGGDFQTVSVAWQYSWLGRPN